MPGAGLTQSYFSLYQLVPGFIVSSGVFFFFFFLFTQIFLNTLLYSQKTISFLIWRFVHWTKWGSHGALSPPPCSHNLSSHTWTPLSFFYPQSKQERLSLITLIQTNGISCHVHCVLHGQGLQSNKQAHATVKCFFLYINHLSFGCKCHFAWEN